MAEAGERDEERRAGNNEEHGINEEYGIQDEGDVNEDEEYLRGRDVLERVGLLCIWRALVI